uniref:Fe2OG dioxygenase domain-containing protein n=1 Tax=Romanomermis culicivorax TaxID=13658 RepID=A0A915KNI3_ROMCU
MLSANAERLDERDQFYDCACFFWSNIYIASLNRHFKFINKQQFYHDYRHIVDSNTDFDEVLNQMGILDPVFIDICRRSLEMIAVNFLSYMELYGVGGSEFRLYQFPVFTESFCVKLIEEIDNFNKNPYIPKERPNTMNKYGVLLDEMGMLPLIDEVRKSYLNHLSKCLFPDVFDDTLDSHRAFTVAYTRDTEAELGFHYDNAEVTLNVALDDCNSFKGGQVYFCGMRNDPIESTSCCAVDHKLGYGILHRGQQLHGALPIEQGRRSNLIIWMRSSKTRAILCPMCNDKSRELIACPAGDYGDGFKKYQENVCNLI